MKNKDEEVDMASQDSRGLPRPLQYPLPAHVARSPSASSDALRTRRKKAFPPLLLLSFHVEAAWCRGKG